MNIPMTQHLPATAKVVHDVQFGSGSSLNKRKAIEYAGYYLPKAGYMSEDLNYCQHLNAWGFDLAVDCGLHCGHFEEDGRIY
jgi:hypothetical protein